MTFRKIVAPHFRHHRRRWLLFMFFVPVALYHVTWSTRATMEGGSNETIRASVHMLNQASHDLEEPRRQVSIGGIQDACRVRLTSTCPTPRAQAVQRFTSIYRNADWGTWDYSHTRSGDGSTIKGAFENVYHLEPKFRELGIRSVADVPSGDCGWQFALSTINTAEAYFGGDIAHHVAEDNARRFHNHLNKVFAPWDIVECPLPRWYTSCDPTPRIFDVVIVRDALQHMTVTNAIKALKLIVEKSGATYLALTSYSTNGCQDQCQEAGPVDGGFYHNNVHCPPFSLPQPFFKFASHAYFPREPDFMELYRVGDLIETVASWPEQPCGA